MMDFVFDYISVNAFWTIVLIVHALLAVATLGALTHQAMSVAMPARQLLGPQASSRVSAAYMVRATQLRFASCGWRLLS